MPPLREHWKGAWMESSCGARMSRAVEKHPAPYVGKKQVEYAWCEHVVP
ncbi:MAG: hypothetical protein ACXW1N_07295 [Halobacteriota archaeon]